MIAMLKKWKIFGKVGKTVFQNMNQTFFSIEINFVFSQDNSLNKTTYLKTNIIYN